MNTHADKTKENKSQTLTAKTSQMQSGVESTFQFVDNRPESIQMQQLQELANNSAQISGIAQLQAMANNHSTQQQEPIQKKENNTGLPDNLKTGTENLSGLPMGDVKFHYNSDKPAQRKAHACARGTDIHAASGQEKHPPHEAWQVVQQKQGRVKPTMQMKGKVNVNDDSGLEREADLMGGKALQLKTNENNPVEQISVANVVAQRVPGDAEKENDRVQYLESWSENAEAFVWSEDGELYKGVQGGEKVEVTTSDDRNFKTEKDNNSDAIVANHELIEGAENIDKLEPSIIKNLVSKGSKLRDVMQNSCYESWEFMTHELNKLGEIPETEECKEKKNNRKTLLQKIWEYRQWHHDFILKQTQSEIGKENLSSWASAGSTTLTSDIDINLKGDNTELAVQEFNTLFKADGWKYEAGTVYDVNVYALDFMHAGYVFGKGEKVLEGGFEMVMDIHGNLLKKKNAQDETVEDNTTGRTKKTGKEGSKKGQAEGGFSGKNPDVILKDSVNQEVWTYVKARLYMKTSEWNTFAENIDLKDEIKREVEAKYGTYVQNMKAKIGDAESEENELETGIQSLIANAKKVAEKGGAEGHQLDVETSQLMIGGSNRIYEEKLVPIHALRKKLKKVIDKYNAALNAQQTDKLANLNRLIDMNLLELRNLVSEATIYSNEAYLTDGAVNHAVVGIQSNKSIELTNNETLHALIENMADSLKEIARHGATLGEAAFKAGKYMFRLADAAMNMGYKNEEMTKLYKAGDVISNEIKKNVEDSEEQKIQSAAAVDTYLNVRESSVNLATKVRELATKAIKWKQGKGEAFGMNKSSAVGSNKG